MRIQILSITFFAFLSASNAFADVENDGWFLKTFILKYMRPVAKPAEPYELNTGVTGGMSADRAVYVQGENVGQHWASAQRVVSLVTWRGRRAQVTLRLKNEGGIGSNLAMVV
ncbi:hypothetical protein, partial [Bradyrhizobium sp.]|uniref:hypothetical protein n=1 Tax=Bradyrhizobium sp. TaxID=376 RepID=UPI0025BFAA96